MKIPLLLLLSLGLGAPGAGLSGDFKGPLGLQLYTLREAFKTNVPGALDKAKALGFSEIEGGGDYGLGIEKFNALLQERGLKMVSAGFGHGAMANDIAGAVHRAQAFAVKFVMCAWIPHAGLDDMAAHSEGRWNEAKDELKGEWHQLDKTFPLVLIRQPLKGKQAFDSGTCNCARRFWPAPSTVRRW